MPRGCPVLLHRPSPDLSFRGQRPPLSARDVLVTGWEPLHGTIRHLQCRRLRRLQPPVRPRRGTPGGRARGRGCPSRPTRSRGCSAGPPARGAFPRREPDSALRLDRHLRAGIACRSASRLLDRPGRKASMDLNYSTEELAFRDEVRAWLRANLPDDLRQKMESYRGAVQGRPPALAQDPGQEGLGRARLAGRVGRDGLERRAEVHLRGGVRLCGHPSAGFVRPPHVRARSC